MKNLILTVSLIFVLGASAQSKKPTPKTVATVKVSNEVAAAKNLADLNAFTPLQPEMKAMMLELFTTKYRMLTESGELSAERKATVSQIISAKLEGTLDPAVFAKVKTNTALYKSLIN
jgi:hypothetical protein